ncbi:C45 family peptidase [Streptosporangium sp. KLBMP 9127]|nr:C45 family peptidase [Streptosporangium sp. KLBMP 9127]
MNELSIVAGGRDDFMTVRHLVVRGDHTSIGAVLAEEARDGAGWVPTKIDPVINRARWTWFERNWPQQYARISGAARALGVDPDDDRLCLDGMPTLPSGSGCSAVWCPPEMAADGRGRVARNYDLFTLSEQALVAMATGGDPAAAGGLPMASRPYVVTMYPDDGLASTALTMSELDGCTEGINEAGLSVVLLLAEVADNEPPTMPIGPQVGLNVTQVPRFLLDTCENVEQAKQALLGAKHYNQGVPCHYLVADASGKAFVWERGRADTEHILTAAGGALCATNHLLHAYPDVDDLPPDTEQSFHTYARARTLAKHTTGQLSAHTLRDTLDAVAMRAVPEEPWRTMWRSVFDVADRTMTTRFYLGDGEYGTARYSAEVTFGATR